MSPFVIELLDFINKPMIVYANLWGYGLSLREMHKRMRGVCMRGVSGGVLRREGVRVVLGLRFERVGINGQTWEEE